MSDENTIDFEALRAEFEHDQIGWVPIYKKSDRVLVSAFVDARAIQDRLDAVVGPERWQTRFEPGPDGGVMCHLSLRVGDQWVSKADAAENTKVEEVKGGISNAFKRAAVAWGIGRYLYSIDAVWRDCDAKGKWIPPRLPSSAGKNPPGEKRAPAPVSPRDELLGRLRKLEFSDEQVSAFATFVAGTYKLSSPDEVPAEKWQKWLSRMEKNSDAEVREKVLNALN